jgi:hypothetical protein
MELLRGPSLALFMRGLLTGQQFKARLVNTRLARKHRKRIVRTVMKKTGPSRPSQNHP